jgi:prepilin-type N-terminal cleavage/methylation domain-containing protein
MIADSRFGFTLIEVVVALIVSAMAVTAAAVLLGTLGDQAETIRRSAATVDGRANAEHLLRQLVANAQGGDSSPSFVGDSRSVSMRTWCETPQGWLDRCAARFVFERRVEGDDLLLQLTGADSSAVALRRNVRNGSVRYLLNVESGGTWAVVWEKPSPPEALAIVLDSDTLLLPVGGGPW